MANDATSAPDAQATPRDCSTCLTSGRKGYCALGRCYCGHETCPAFASWVDLSAVPLRDEPKPKRKPSRSSWDDREGETWIDSL